MKKLMVMLSAAAMAFGLFADATSVQTSFEADDAGVAEGKFTPATAGWTWAGDPLTLGTYDAEKDPAYVYGGTVPERRTGWASGTAQTKYLPLETGKDTLACERTAADDNYVVDQLVKFTGFEEMQETFAEGTKIAIWQAYMESDDETEGVTNKNLYVSVGSVDGTVALSLGEYDPEVWHRLTIKSIKDIGNGRTGFVIYINGTQVASADEAAKFLFDEDTLTTEAKNLMAKGLLFPSMVADEVETLASVGYQGIGAIDDVIIDQLGPDFVQSVDFVLAGVPTNADVDSVVDSNGETLTKDPLTGKYTADAGVTVTVTLAAKKGWFFGDGTKSLEIKDLVPSAELDITKGGTVDVSEVAAAAQKGETDFLTLQAAIDDTTVEADVELLDDVELAAPITAPAGAEFTLNLREFEITSAEDFTGGDYLFELGNATAIVKNGMITTDKRAFHVVGGVLTVDVVANCDGRVIGAYAGSVVEVAATSSLTTSGDDVTIFVRGNTVDKSTDGIKGALVVYGSVANEFEGDQNAISGNGWDWVGVDITIAGTVYTEGTGAAIYKPQAGTLTITENAEVTGATGIYAKSGAVVIDGGSVVASGDAADPEVNNNGYTSTGDALVLEKLAAGAGGYSNDLTCQITGGMLESEYGHTVRSWAREGITALAGFIGENALFKGAEMPTDYIVVKPGYAAKWSEPDEDGYVTAEWEVVKNYVAQVGEDKYETLDEALAAATAGQTVTLLANIETAVAQQWTIAKNITINFADKTITKTVANDWVFTIANGADVTFTGTTGGIVHYPAVLNQGNPASMIQIFGKLTVNGGVYESDYTVLKVDEGVDVAGEVVVNDGTFTIAPRPDTTYTGKTYAVMNWSKATLNGGTFNGNVVTLSCDGNKGVQAGETIVGTIDGTPVYKLQITGSTYKNVPKIKGVAKTAVELVVPEAITDELELVEDGEYVTVAKKVTDITVTVKKGTGIASVTVGAEALVFDANDEATFTVSADTLTAQVTLAAESTITIPVYKQTLGKEAVGYSVITKSFTFTAEADKENYVTFAAVQAEMTDPQVTDEQAAAAIKDVATTEAGKAKVDAVVAGGVTAKNLATWIDTKAGGNVDTALAGDYVKASVALDVAPITVSTPVEVATVDKTTSDLAVTIKVNGVDATKEQIEGFVQVCDDLGVTGEWQKLPESTLKSAVTISEGKLVITPVAGVDKLFLKVVIPQDAK